MRSLDVEEGQGCPQPLLLANSEQGVWAVLLSPKHHVCGLLAEAGNGIEIPLGGEKELPVAGLGSSFPCSFKSAFGGLIWIPDCLDSQ